MNKHSGKDRVEMNEFLLLLGLGTHLQVFSASRPGTIEREDGKYCRIRLAA